jgi:hypothetical protein
MFVTVQEANKGVMITGQAARESVVFSGMHAEKAGSLGDATGIGSKAGPLDGTIAVTRVTAL